jgi:hypothetical protein
MHNYDVITTTDKAKRDDIFRQMRESTDPLERASVKFSGNEPVLNEDGTPQVAIIRYQATGKGGKINLGRRQSRPVMVSNWSVATPRSDV